MKLQTCTIIVLSENKPGVLFRIADVFLRRKINIESLQVAEIGKSGESQFTIVIQTDNVVIDTVIKQLKRIIEVREVFKE
jgi:acetolactate synthase-1/3 small subunit